MRFELATRAPQGRSSEQRLADLDKAIRSLEPLASYDQLWANLLRECLSGRQRIIAPQEPKAMNINGLSINDQT